MTRGLLSAAALAAAVAAAILTSSCEAPWQSTPPSSPYGGTINRTPAPIINLPTATPPPLASPTPTAAPTAVPPTAPPSLGVTIQASEYGLLSVLTRPGASCTPSGTLPNGKPVPGLGPIKIADSKGLATWVYNAAATDTSSNGTHRVTCTIAGLSGSDSASFDPDP